MNLVSLAKDDHYITIVLQIYITWDSVIISLSVPYIKASVSICQVSCNFIFVIN